MMIRGAMILAVGFGIGYSRGVLRSEKLGEAFNKLASDIVEFSTEEPKEDPKVLTQLIGWLDGQEWPDEREFIALNADGDVITAGDIRSLSVHYAPVEILTPIDAYLTQDMLTTLVRTEQHMKDSDDRVALISNGVTDEPIFTIGDLRTLISTIKTKTETPKEATTS